MADVVFILGAGASQQGGAPVMSNFLDKARRLLFTGAVQGRAGDFARVFEAIGKLQAVHSKAQDLDITNVESVFAAFEMARLLGRMPGYGVGEIDALIAALKTVIAYTLESTLNFNEKRAGDLPVAPDPYPRFVELLRESQAASPPYRHAILTFNYDLALDYALHQGGIPVRYCLDDSDPPAGIPLLKLHGSLNWVAGATGEVVPWRMDRLLAESAGIVFRRHAEGVFRLCTTAHILDRPSGEHPVIVPPTWNKYGYQSEFTRVWAQAAQELSDAQHIFVIGYSLPESDLFFRYLYALGSVGDNPLEMFRVYDPDERVGPRFQSMLGPGARIRFRHVATSFERAIGLVEAILKKRQKWPEPGAR
ncbi:hypothetical protein [Acidiferrobacter sp.]|uniref:hypothetical protein n=1 Tax=Acidiferrobacter sp. TaxID=1872107 RepID=UPI0026046578|nr:hypothetical protein [Acidiferrobacter sp.]